MSNAFVGRTCPYCQNVIKRADEIVECPACETVHHRECWMENGRCTTPMCSGAARHPSGLPDQRRQVETPPRPPRPPPAPAQSPFHVVLGALVGALVGIGLIGPVSACLSYVPYSPGSYLSWGDGPIAWGRAFGGLVGLISGIVLAINIAKDEWQSLLGRILACIFLVPIGVGIGDVVGLCAGMLVALLITGLLPVVLGLALGLAGGALLAVIVRTYTHHDEMPAGCWLGALAGGIVSGIAWRTGDRFLANTLFVSMFAWAGYAATGGIETILSAVPALGRSYSRWLALAYVCLFIAGAFSHSAVFGLLLAGGAVTTALLAIYRQTWEHSLVGAGCIVAPLLGALAGTYGSGLLVSLPAQSAATSATVSNGPSGPATPQGDSAAGTEPARTHASYEKKAASYKGLQQVWTLQGAWTGVVCDEAKAAIYAIGQGKLAEIDLAGEKHREFGVTGVSGRSGRVLLRIAAFPISTGKAVLVFGDWGDELQSYDLSGHRLWSYSVPEESRATKRKSVSHQESTPSRGAGIDDVWVRDLNGDGADEIVVGYNGSAGLHVLDCEGKLLWKYTAIGNVWHVCAGDVLGDGKPQVISTSSAGKVHVFDGAGQLVKDIDPGCYAGMVRTGTLSEGGRSVILVAGSAHGSMKEILTAINCEGTREWSLELRSRSDNVESAEVAPGRRWLAVGMRSGQVHVVDIANGQLIASIDDPSGIPGEEPEVAWARCADGGTPMLLVASSRELSAFHLTNSGYASTSADGASSPIAPSREPRSRKAPPARPLPPSPPGFPRLEPPGPRAIAPSSPDKPSVAARDKMPAAIRRTLAGRWKGATGAEFVVEDDGNAVTIRLLKETGALASFSGSLFWQDAKPPCLAGRIKATFRINEQKKYDTKVTLLVESPTTLLLRWEDVPVFDADGEVLRTRDYSYTLTKQD